MRDGIPAVPVPHSLFASAGDEPRRRRVDDAAVLGLAGLAVLGAALAAQGSTAAAEETVDALDRLLGWLDPLWAIAYAGAGIVCLVLITAALVARRLALARDLVLAVALTVGLGALLTQAADGRWPSFSGAFWADADPTYPSLRLAIVTAVVMVAGPDLTRPMRYVSVVVVCLSAVGAMVVGGAFPAHVLGGAGLGVAIAAAVRLAFGSSAGFPDERRVVAGWRRWASRPLTCGATPTSGAEWPATARSTCTAARSAWPSTGATPVTPNWSPAPGAHSGTATRARRRRSPAASRSSTRASCCSPRRGRVCRSRRRWWPARRSAATRCWSPTSGTRRPWRRSTPAPSRTR